MLYRGVQSSSPDSQSKCFSMIYEYSLSAATTSEPRQQSKPLALSIGHLRRDRGGLEIAEIIPLDQISTCHELVERPIKPGRVIVAVP
jgi:hypothetical protein